MAAEVCINPGRFAGSDVISRISYVLEKDENRIKMQGVLAEKLDETARKLVERVQEMTEGSSTEDVLCDGNRYLGSEKLQKVVVVGNTVMCEMMLGLSVDGLATAPFHKAYQGAVHKKGHELGCIFLADTDIVKINESVGFFGNAVYYFETVFVTEKEMRVDAQFGRNVPFKVWLNGEMVAQKDGNEHFYYETRHRLALPLKKGENTLLFMVVNNTDNGKYRRYCIACKNTENERNELGHLVLLLSRADDYGSEGNETAKETEKVVAAEECGAVSLNDVAHSRACKRETDESNGRADDDGRKKLAYPSGADSLNDNCDNYVNETCNYRAEHDTAVTVCNGYSERVQECEGASEEYGALKASEELINESTYACAENSRGDLSRKTDYRGNRNSCRKNCEQLLESEDQHLAEFGFVMDVVDQILCHLNSLR